MSENVTRRKFLGGAVAAAAGTAAMSGEAAARYIGQPLWTTDYIYIYDGPGTSNNFLRRCNAYTGLEIADGPVNNEGYTWWKYYVNGDEGTPSRELGWGIQGYTTPAEFSYPTWGEIVGVYNDYRDFLGRYHESIDIANDYGTKIRASYPGTAYVNYGDSYGNWIQIEHGNGWDTRYAHLQDVHVSNGQQVSRDEVIGTMGCVGDCWPKSQGGHGPHLHFEIRHNGNRQYYDMDRNTHIWWGSGIEHNFW